MALIEAAREGRSHDREDSEILLRVRPEARTYALNITRIGGILTVLIVGVLLYVFVLRPRRKLPEGK